MERNEKLIKKIMVICAHPDDADLLTGGLTFKLTSSGHKVKYVAITNGNLGHHKKSTLELAQVRKMEAEASAKVLGAEFISLNIDDGQVYVNREQTEKIVKVIREFDPDLVITHRPYDYHRDDRYTGQLVMDASYMLIVPHYCPETPISISRKMPIICYGYDHFQKPYAFIPHIMMDIGDVFEQKANALLCHESQMMEWLPWTMNMENQIPDKKDIQRWKEILELIYTSTFSRVISNYHELWKKGFPEKIIKQVEVFELCEYGRQALIKELEDLFPEAYFPSKQDLIEIGK